MFASTLVVDAHQTMEDAAVRCRGIPDEAYVVVRRRDGLDLYFYSYRAGFLREMASRAPTGLVIEVLNLHGSGATPTTRLGEAPTAGGPVVVVDGDSCVGVLLDEQGSGDRGVLVRGLESGPHASDLWADTETMAPTARAEAGTEAHEVSGGGAGAAVEDRREPDAGLLAAFPELSCPESVSVGQTFELVVGLSTQESAGTVGGQIDLPDQPAEPDLVVTVVAPGFDVPRTRDVLHVVRADLRSQKVRFTLTAQPFEGAVRPATIQVDFAYGGQLCGRAWRAVVVSAADMTAAAPAASAPRAGGAPLTTSTQVLAETGERPPDLVVTITENDDSTQLEWTFTTRHPGIALPERQVSRRFRAHNAKSFAMEQVRLIHESLGAAIGNRMLGVARTIADQVPPEAWQVLSDVWARTAAEQPPRPPSVLLVSTDAYIPWELASTEAAYVDPPLLDPAAPPVLGAQVCVSRWNAPQPRGARGVLNPKLPPDESLVVDEMALVIGDYLAINGQRPLPKALEEGNMLAALYRAVRLSATMADIDPLFDGNLVRDGRRVEPQLVHFACHGQVDANPRFNGIVLNEGNVRLDALYVAGNRMTRPFVFLNACQVGQATQLLDDAGGLATSFLGTGARGFVAPLWNVDDQVAQDTALEFYELALGEGVPVAEVLRRRRARFDADAVAPQATHLAYVFYGHPNLQLTRASTVEGDPYG